MSAREIHRGSIHVEIQIQQEPVRPGLVRPGALRPAGEGSRQDRGQAQRLLRALARAAAQRSLCRRGAEARLSLARGLQAGRAGRQIPSPPQGSPRARSGRGTGRLECAEDVVSNAYGAILVAGKLPFAVVRLLAGNRTVSIVLQRFVECSRMVEVGHLREGSHTPRLGRKDAEAIPSRLHHALEQAQPVLKASYES